MGYKYIENIVIGDPIYPLKELLCDGTVSDWENEYDKTLFTATRNLASILKEIGVVKSIGEVKRNKPELCKDFTDADCFWIKWGKRKFYVIVSPKCICGQCIHWKYVSDASDDDPDGYCSCNGCSKNYYETHTCEKYYFVNDAIHNGDLC